jgi:hypothetical protein
MMKEAKKKVDNKNSNNKGLPMKKSKHTPHEDHPIILAPKIDKLSGVVNLPNQELGQQAFSTLLEWSEDPQEPVTKVGAKGKYSLAVLLHYPNTESLVDGNSHFIHIQIINTKAGASQIRFDYNPSYISEVAEDYLDTYFTALVGASFYQFLHHATFTRVDWCRTIPNRDMEDYLVSMKWQKHSLAHFTPQTGKIGSLTFGKSSGNQLQVYNKAKQLYGEVATHNSIRLEARVRMRGGILGLATMPNPFRHTSLYSVHCPQPPYGEAHWRGFVDSCRLRGIPHAIKMQPASHRAKLKQALSAKPVSWWHMTDEAWEYYSTAALEDAGLTQIPNYAPPLTMKNAVGEAA